MRPRPRVGESYVSYLERGNAAAIPLVGGNSQGVCCHGIRACYDLVLDATPFLDRRARWC